MPNGTKWADGWTGESFDGGQTVAAEALMEKIPDVRIAYYGEKIVCFGRTVDDGKYYGMIVDLVVDPDFQGSGIGSKILRELRDEMRGYKIIGLRAAPGMQDFYLKQGWKKSNSAFNPNRK